MGATTPAPRPGHDARHVPEPDYLFGSIMATPVRLAYGLGPLIQVLEERGHDVAPLLDAAEIPRFALEEPSYRIRLDQETRFTRHALHSLQLAAAGLVVGRRYHLAMFGVLGLAAACAASVHEMFHIILDHPVLAWGMFDVGVWKERDAVTLVLEDDNALGDCAPFFRERDLACALTLVRDALAPGAVPAAVSFRHAAPGAAGGYEEFFGCQVRFGHAATAIRFDHALWHGVPRQADTMAFRFFARQCRTVSAMLLEPLDYGDVVRSRLRSATPMPSLHELAAALHLTARTLQRRLAAEGTTFSALLREVRLERVDELLCRGRLRIEEIAWRLGYQDAVAFSHAFRQWTGMSPHEYRCSGLRAAPRHRPQTVP